MQNIGTVNVDIECARAQEQAKNQKQQHCG